MDYLALTNFLALSKNAFFQCVCLTFLLIGNAIVAQSKGDDQIDIAVGLGITIPDEEIEGTDIVGNGFYAQGEYVHHLSNWIGLRPYVGFIITNDADDEAPINYESTTKAAFLGGKGRLKFPIPYVAPYIELGIGASIGSFRTLTPFEDEDKSGIDYHIPFALGLELGKNHGFDFGFSYYFHPNNGQISGAVAFGISIPVKRKTYSLQ